MINKLTFSVIVFISCINTNAQDTKMLTVDSLMALGRETLQNSDTVKTIAYFTEAAERGLENAQFELGNLYIRKNEYDNARNWLNKAAEQGNLRALNNIGLSYAREEKYEDARKWYLKGEGVTKNFNEAFRLFTLSANQGFWMGEYGLAYMYENGFGTEKNIEEAIKWYKAAQSHGHEGATEVLNKLEKGRK